MNRVSSGNVGVSIRNDRLDALRALVARAVHKRRNGVRGQVRSAVRYQQRLELRGLLHRRVEPAVEVLRPEDHRHPVVSTLWTKKVVRAADGFSFPTSAVSDVLGTRRRGARQEGRVQSNYPPRPLPLFAFVVLAARLSWSLAGMEGYRFEAALLRTKRHGKATRTA